MKGLKEIQNNFNKILKNIGDFSKESLQDVVLDLQGVSQDRAPVETGNLRGTGNSEVKKTEAGFIGEVGFNAPYALKQHENLHYKHPGGGEAKFLENPLVENTEKYIEWMKNGVKKGLK
jgi:hypothetical protein